MAESQSNEPGFESPDDVDNWEFLLSPRRPSSLSYINEYLAVNGGGNVSEYFSHIIAAWLECFPEKLSWCRNEHRSVKSVKRFEWSNGLDTALYKTYLYIRVNKNCRIAVNLHNV